MTGREILRAVGRALLYAVVTSVVVLALAILLSGPSQQERRETNENVRMLVDEARKNREVLCIAVVRNPANVARDDPRLRKLCAEIGVTP